MKKHMFFKSPYLIRISTLVMLYMALCGCEKDTVISEPVLPPNQKQSLSENNSSSSVTNRDNGKCKCQYQAISWSGVNNNFPNGHLEYSLLGGEYQQFDQNCRYFEGHYGDCFVGSEPNCDDDIVAMPSSYYYFNCHPSRNSSFNVEFVPELYWYAYPICGGVEAPINATITFQIRCGGDPNSGSFCPGENGSAWYYSNTKTLNYPAIGGSSPFPKAQVNLTDCGCKPEIL